MGGKSDSGSAADPRLGWPLPPSPPAARQTQNDATACDLCHHNNNNDGDDDQNDIPSAPAGWDVAAPRLTIAWPDRTSDGDGDDGDAATTEHDGKRMDGDDDGRGGGVAREAALPTVVLLLARHDALCGETAGRFDYAEGFTLGELHLARESFEHEVPPERRLLAVQCGPGGGSGGGGRVALDLADVYRWVCHNPQGSLFGPFGACRLTACQRRWLVRHARSRLGGEEHVAEADAYEPEWWDALDALGGGNPLLLPYHEVPTADALDGAIADGDVDAVLHVLTAAAAHDRDDLVDELMDGDPLDALCRVAATGQCAMFRYIAGHPHVRARLSLGGLTALLSTFIASTVGVDVVLVIADALHERVSAATRRVGSGRASDAGSGSCVGHLSLASVPPPEDDFVLTQRHVLEFYRLCCRRPLDGRHLIAVELWRRFGVVPDADCLVYAVEHAADDLLYLFAERMAPGTDAAESDVVDACDACLRSDRPDLLRFLLRWGGRLVTPAAIIALELAHAEALSQPEHFHAASVLAHWRRQREGAVVRASSVHRPAAEAGESCAGRPPTSSGDDGADTLPRWAAGPIEMPAPVRLPVGASNTGAAAAPDDRMSDPDARPVSSAVRDTHRLVRDLGLWHGGFPVAPATAASDSVGDALLVQLLRASSAVPVDTPDRFMADDEDDDSDFQCAEEEEEGSDDDDDGPMGCDSVECVSPFGGDSQPSDHESDYELIDAGIGSLDSDTSPRSSS